MAVITVTTENDSTNENDGVTSLREAIQVAAVLDGPDTIVFAPDVETVRFNNDIVIGQTGLTIDGDRDGDGLADVTLSGGGQTELFFWSSGSSGTMRALTIADGRGEDIDGSGPGGNGVGQTAAISNRGELLMERVVFTNNIQTSGSGQNGQNGSNGGSGSDGANGTISSATGKPGSDGGNGGNSPVGGGDGGYATVLDNRAGGTLTLRDVAFDDTNQVSAGSGGLGGNGGRGGNGGDGGDSFLLAFTVNPGGRGGDGGNGGRGTNGGDGGDASAVRNDDALVVETAIADSTGLFAGNAGGGGSGGSGGSGGTGGRDNSISRNRAPDGSDGRNGGSGFFGEDGVRASVVNTDNATLAAETVEVVETLVYAYTGVAEAEEGESVTVNVNRAGLSGGGYTVFWEVTDPADVEGSGSGSVSLTAGGPDSVAVTLGLADDGIGEGAETLTFRLTGIEAADGSPAAGFGTSEIPITVIDAGASGGPFIGTPGPDTLSGTSGDDVIDALGGNDTIAGSAGSDTIEGGTGQDTVVYSLTRDELGQTLEASGAVTVDVQNVGFDRLTGVERIEFEGGRLVFDIETVETPDVVGDDLAFIYRLYDASYARIPDEAGIRFWAGVYDGDEIDGKGLAEFFVESPEYEETYPNATDEEYIDQLYENALRREADAAGKTFWLTAFQTGRLDRADMLLEFAQSPENVERNAPNVDDGLYFLESDSFDISTLV